ncbi:nucleoporin complex subunit 54-domain-containing protein [Sporodiniella umbellata]|nr:nucleoporin complex subunit 54-domain-containing protein [Sporodiniella umbellata]
MSLFGASANQPNTAFGSTANTQSSAAGTLFGTNNNSSAGTLFGANTSNPSSGGFGGFGQKPTATNAFGTAASAPATGFGKAAPAASGAFTFGASQPTANVNNTGGFGQAAPAASSAFTFGANQSATNTNNTGGFGASNNTFGTANTNANAGGLSSFNTGANTVKPAFGGFGASSNTFGAQPQQQTGFGQQQQQAKPPIQEKVWQELALMRAKFDPSSPLCNFRHYFYNMVPRSEVHLYVRPPNQDENLWNEAQRKNPDPESLVPVLAVGFDDVLKRMEIQSRQSELYQQKLKEVENRLAHVHHGYSLGTLVKLEEHKRRHIDITQRLLRLLRYSQILRYKNFPLNGEEETTFLQLQNLAGASNGPEELYTKMVGLWNQLQAYKARMSEIDARPEVWRSVSEDDTNRLAQVIEDEQMGILHVANVLKSDTKEIDDIMLSIKNH